MSDVCYMSIFFVSFMIYSVFMFVIFTLALFYERFDQMIIPSILVGLILSFIVPFVHTVVSGVVCG